MTMNDGNVVEDDDDDDVDDGNDDDTIKLKLAKRKCWRLHTVYIFFMLC